MKTVWTPPSEALVAGALALAIALAACTDREAVPAGGPKSGPTVGRPAAQGSEAGKGKGSKGGASAQLAFQTGLQLLLKGDPEKALGEFERASKLDPTLSEAFHELGKLQVGFSAQNVGSQARDLDVLDKGLAALERASELEPSNDQYWFWVGKACSLKNEGERAIACLEKAVELNPKHARAWKALGLAQKGASRTEAARTSFQKAVEHDPSDSGAYFQLGQVLEVLKDLEGARSAYERAIELHTTEAEVFGRLTQVCAMLGDADCEERARAGMEVWEEFDKRLQRRRRFVNQNPGDAAGLRRLGEAYFEVGKWEEALEWFLKAIHIDPRDALAHLECGIVRRRMEDFVNAANHLKEAEFLAPDNLDPKLELLRLHADTGDEASLVELLTSVEAAAAEDGASLFALGEVCAELGRAQDAQRLFQKARALGVTEAPRADAPTETEDP